MAQVSKTQLKFVDKYQFEQKRFAPKNGIEEVQAIHMDTKETFTLKRICLNNSQQKQKYTYVLHELSALKKLNHPAIPKCHKLLKTSNNLYLIFSEIRGEELSHYMQGDLNMHNCILIAASLMQILVYLEKVGMCHCQIQPSSILMDLNGHLQLINFGFAEEHNGKEIGLNQYHQNQPVTQFTAPQVKLMKINSHTDLFSAGVVLKKLFLLLKNQFSLDDKNQQIIHIDNIIQYVEKMINQIPEKRITVKQAYQFFSKESIPSKHIKIPQKYRKTPQKQTKSQQKHTKSPQKRTKSPQNDVKFQSQRHLLSITQHQQGRSINKITYQSPGSDKDRYHSPHPSNLKLRRTSTNNEVGMESQQCLWIARKVLKKRNFSQFLLELASFSTSLSQVVGIKCAALGFLLLKKSTIVVSQLAKFLQTGKGEGLRMDQRTRDKLNKHIFFSGLQKTIHKQMKVIQNRLVNTAKYLRNKLGQRENNPNLWKQLEIEAISNDYVRKCSSDVYHDILNFSNPSEAQIDLKKQQLLLLFTMGLLSEYKSYDDLFDSLFSESACKLWDQPYFKQLMLLDQSEIIQLINVQGEITYSNSLNEICVSMTSSHRRA